MSSASSLLRFACIPAGALSLHAATHAAETTYPTKPVRFIVPYPPGGSADPTARVFGQWLTERFGTTIVIDNRPGAGSALGHAIGAKAAPDGYTIVLGTSAGLVVQPALGTKLAYDPVKDFTPIGLVVNVPFLLVVHPSVPAKSSQELIELGKAQPGKVIFGSPGTGTPNHLGMELMRSMTGAQFVHVPYKGGGPATVDLVAGRIQALFGSIPQWQPHLAAGRVRVLGVGHPTRVKSMPEVPAIAETLSGFNNTSWYGIVGPAGVPEAVVTRLNAETQAAAANPAFVKQIEGIGLEPASGTPQELGNMIRTEIARWTKVIKSSGIKVD
jgi:tripartite-type tricarboxylate transporter receptor subunit TctC